MPTKYKVQTDTLLIEVTGVLNLIDAAAAQANAVRIVREKELGQVLVDLRESTPDATTVEYFEFAASFADRFPRNTRFAMVFSPKKMSLENADFFETVAVNRGSSIKMFVDLANAESWLAA
jgi:hypothetical protein